MKKELNLKNYYKNTETIYNNLENLTFTLNFDYLFTYNNLLNSIKFIIDTAELNNYYYKKFKKLFNKTINSIYLYLKDLESINNSETKYVEPDIYNFRKTFINIEKENINNLRKKYN